MKLNGTHQLLVYDDDVNILVGSVHPIQKNTEASLVGSKKIGLDVNADRTLNMVRSRVQNAGRSHNIKMITAPLNRWNSSNIWEQT